MELVSFSEFDTSMLFSELELLFALLSVNFLTIVCIFWREEYIYIYDGLLTCSFHIAAVTGLCCHILVLDPK